MICVYVPHKGRTNPAQVDTYEALEALIGRAPFRDTVILMEDFNSRLRRKARNGEIKPTYETLFADVPNLSIENATNMSKDRKLWSSNRPSLRC